MWQQVGTGFFFSSSLPRTHIRRQYMQMSAHLTCQNSHGVWRSHSTAPSLYVIKIWRNRTLEFRCSAYLALRILKIRNRSRHIIAHLKRKQMRASEREWENSMGGWRLYWTHRLMNAMGWTPKHSFFVIILQLSLSLSFSLLVASM